MALVVPQLDAQNFLEPFVGNLDQLVSRAKERDVFEVEVAESEKRFEIPFLLGYVFSFETPGVL